MTPLPHSVDANAPLEHAAQVMVSLGVRHLPVLAEGKLTGILSARDIHLAKAIRSSEADALPVAKAMREGPYAVGPAMPVQQAIHRMAEHKIGCVVVVDDDAVVGLFTTIDALWLLEDLLSQRDAYSLEKSSPSRVRERMQREHALMRRQLSDLERYASAAVAGDTRSSGELMECARTLYRDLLRFFDLEDSLLAPILRDTDAFGPHRADELLAKHAKWRGALRNSLTGLEQGEAASAKLANTMIAFAQELRDQLEHEARSVLQHELLRDDTMSRDAFGG